MKKILIFLIFISIVSVVSYANSVSISTVNVEAQSGVLTSIYFESSSASTLSTPTINTALIPPITSSSYKIDRGDSDRLWSPQFSKTTDISSGSWVIVLYAKGATAGEMTVSLYVTNSAGSVQSTITSASSTSSIGTSKTEVKLTFAGSAVVVPVNGYIETELTAPTGSGNPSSFTVYWGSGELTDIQVPTITLSS